MSFSMSQIVHTKKHACEVLCENTGQHVWLLLDWEHDYPTIDTISINSSLLEALALNYTSTNIHLWAAAT